MKFPISIKSFLLSLIVTLSIVSYAHAAIPGNCQQIANGENCGAGNYIVKDGCSSAAQINTWNTGCGASKEVYCPNTPMAGPASCRFTGSCDEGYSYNASTNSCTNCAPGYTGYDHDDNPATSDQCVPKSTVIYDTALDLFKATGDGLWKMIGMWHSSGSDIYYDTGNVGIGTSTPSSISKLHVVTNYNDYAAKAVYGTALWGHGVQGDSTNSAGVVGLGNAGHVPDYYVIDDNIGVYADSDEFGFYSKAPKNYFSGNLGIGTNSPVAKLDVAGSAYFGGNVTAAGDLTVNGRDLYMGSTRLYSNDASALYWDSNSSDYSQMIFRDKEDLEYGRVYGSGNGANFGLLDGDGNWSYLAAKDSYTQFRINDSAKMTIENGGDIGIGTTNPTEKLTISTGTQDYGLLHTDGTHKITTWVGSSGGYLGTTSNHDLRFFVNSGGAKLTVDTTGNIGIGTTSPTYKLDVRGDMQVTDNLRIDQGSLYVSWFDSTPPLYGTASRGSSYDFLAYNGVYAASSSGRWKENIRPITDALNKVLAMRGVIFDWKENRGGAKNSIGMIAEEAGAVVPELVTYEEDGSGDAVSMEYSKLGPILIEAVKEQQKMINALKIEVEQLKDSQ